MLNLEGGQIDIYDSLLDNLPEGSRITTKNCYGNAIGTVAREELLSSCKPGNRKYDFFWI